MAFIEDVELDKHKAKIGYWIDINHRRQGLSQIIAESLINVSFEHLDLDIIEVEVIPENKPSVKSVEKYMREFGGSFDGRIRNATHTPEDGVHDLFTWSISKSEFYDKKAEYNENIKINNQ